MGKITDNPFLATEGRKHNEQHWHKAYADMAQGLTEMVRSGPGETVPATFTEKWARQHFAQALYRVVPTSTSGLLSPYAATLADRILRARRTEASDTVLSDSVEALASLQDHVERWQERHNLAEEWVTSGLWASIWMWLLARHMGYAHPDAPLLLGYTTADVHEGKSEAELYEWERKGNREAHKLIDIPVFLDYLKYPDGDSSESYFDYWENGEIGTYDPRTEKVSAALNRLMPELRKRLKLALQSIADEDRVLNKSAKPESVESPRAFEWLVRFQVCDQSFSEIAGGYGTDYRNVGRQVKRAARMAGFEHLRATDLGGRPSRT